MKDAEITLSGVWDGNDAGLGVVCLAKREQAIGFGTVEISARELAAMTRARAPLVEPLRGFLS